MRPQVFQKEKPTTARGSCDLKTTELKCFGWEFPGKGKKHLPRFELANISSRISKPTKRKTNKDIWANL